MHAVQIDTLRPSLAIDTWTGNSAVTEFDGLALPLELTLVLTNDDDRSPEPPKGSSPGTFPGSWKPAFEAHVARSSPYVGGGQQRLSGYQDGGSSHIDAAMASHGGAVRSHVAVPVVGGAA